MKSRVIPFVVSVLASTIAVGAQAQSFQFQTDADYYQVNLGKGLFNEVGLVEADLNTVQIRQKYFLDDLQNGDNQPWQEAAFLNRSSSVNLNYTRTSIDFSNADVTNSAWGIGGEYMSNNHNFYGALDVSFLNGDNSFASTGKLGFFVQQNWLVALDVYHTNLDGEGSQTDYGLSTKAILPVMNGDHLVLTASVADFEEGDGHAIAADYYLRPFWSVGLALRSDMPSMPNVFGDSVEVRSEYFVMPQLALRGSVSRIDLGAGDENQFAVGASYRF